MTLKPFRLINCTELNTLKQRLNKNLQQWNEQYARFPLTCELSSTAMPIDQFMFTSLLRSEQQQPIALLLQHDISVISHSLFGNSDPCLYDISETLLLNLISTLLETSPLQLQKTIPLTTDNEWFYNGSPSLLLTLHCDQHILHLALHHQWVLNTIPLAQTSTKPICPLNDALAEQVLQLNVVLDPLTLKLADVIRLCVGDVIKTDHPVTTPLKLSHYNKTICDVHLGEVNLNKSIQLMRSS